MAASPLHSLLSGLPPGCLDGPSSPCSGLEAPAGVGASGFWSQLDALRRSGLPGQRNSPGARTGASSVLPSLGRSKTVSCTAPPCADTTGSPAHLGNCSGSSKKGRHEALGHSRTLPLLRGGSGSGGGGGPATFGTSQQAIASSNIAAQNATSKDPLEMLQRTPSMFALPARPSASSSAPLTDSLQLPGGFSAIPEVPMAVLCQGLEGLQLVARNQPAEPDTERRRSCSGGIGQSGNIPLPPDSGDREAGSAPQNSSGSLTARCAAAAGQWKSLKAFSSLGVIASGGHSTVWEAVPKDPSQREMTVAIKAVCMASLGRSALQRLELERRILLTVQHPHIIQGFGSFEDSGYRFLVMEHAGGRNVQQFVSYWSHRNQEDFERASETTVVPEADAAALVLAPLLGALCCLHEQGIIHRDVKAANAVFTRTGVLKLIDFGLSLDTATVAESPCCQIGTMAYWAPELLGEQPPPLELLDRTDCWAVGIMAFLLLTGSLPFHHEVKACLHQMLLEAPIPFKTLELMGASAAATDFIRQALRRDPCQRPTAAQLRMHPWLLTHCGGQALEGNQFAA